MAWQGRVLVSSFRTRVVSNDLDRQDLPDIARWLAGSGNRTGEMLAIRWERSDFTTEIIYVDHNGVRIKGKGLILNDGKTENIRRSLK